MKAYDAVAATIREVGVDTVFGLMGDANMLYLSSFMRDGGHYIPVVHEGSAVSMADGYARIGQRVGVASVTHGPGLTNTLTALVEACRMHSPVVLITGGTPPVQHHIQEFDIQGMARLAGAHYYEVRRAEELTHDISYATSLAATTRMPVVLNIPLGLMEAEVERQAGRPAVVARAAGPDIADGAVKRAIDLIGRSERPLIVAGRGAVLSHAREELLALARQINAPVATSALAKDFFRGHEFNLGIMGGAANSLALEAAENTDCVIAFGAGLNQFTNHHGILSGKILIQFDTDPARIGKHTIPDVGVVADVKASARMLVEQLPRRDERGLCTDVLRDRVAEWSAAGEFLDPQSTSTQDMRVATQLIEAVLPDDKVVITDGGRMIFAPWEFLSVRAGADFNHSTGFGAVGLALATAVGAAVVDPNRVTVAAVGDGGGIMGMLEVSTAVREQLPLVVLVLNDSAYGMECYKLDRSGVDPKYALLAWPEFADLATAMGATGVTVRSEADVAAVAEHIENRRFPLVIDVKVDTDIPIQVLS